MVNIRLVGEDPEDDGWRSDMVAKRWVGKKLIPNNTLDIGLRTRLGRHNTLAAIGVKRMYFSELKSDGLLWPWCGRGHETSWLMSPRHSTWQFFVLFCLFLVVVEDQSCENIPIIYSKEPILSSSTYCGTRGMMVTWQMIVSQRDGVWRDTRSSSLSERQSRMKRGQAFRNSCLIWLKWNSIARRVHWKEEEEKKKIS